MANKQCRVLVKFVNLYSNQISYDMNAYSSKACTAHSRNRWQQAEVKIKNALISVFYKDGLAPIVNKLQEGKSLLELITGKNLTAELDTSIDNETIPTISDEFKRIIKLSIISSIIFTHSYCNNFILII